MKKRETYGTMMVDMNTNRIIDMIETRESEPVTEWLRSYPNLRVVSRDGSRLNLIEKSKKSKIF